MSKPRAAGRQDSSSDPTPSRPPPVLRLFERSRPRTIDLPGMRDLFADFARACAGIIRQVGELDVNAELEVLEQTAGPQLPQGPATLDVASFMPECNAFAIVRFDSILLFRALDAMYGGDPRSRSMAPERPLTPLERAVLLTLTRDLLARLMPDLGLLHAGAAQMAQDIDPQRLKGAEAETVLARLRLVEFGDRITVALPASALDRLGQRLMHEQTADARVVDPGWAQDVARAVGSIKLPVVATIECPMMPLGAIAELRPGGLIEFSGETMRSITLTSGDSPVFTGRLGQSRGMFTILLERPARAQTNDAPPTAV